MNIIQAAEKHADKLKKIRLCAFDCDGILTDSKVFWGGDKVGWNRATNTRDGYGFKMLQAAGLKVGVVSGGNSLSLRKRFVENLKVDFLYAGNEDKRGAYRALLDQGFADHEILYMGDEFFDIPLLKRCGFSATVPEASREILEVVDYVTTTSSGEGCAREVIDMLRHVQSITPEIPGF